ncbi:MotA/TolQ/ExbB proton channel family protein [uncultured Thiodictyon sp.]|jgi:biopolymer transport protein ExbB/TolQ|uniref:MotA/TolQ/ExbB proton channel family protein n=1 Tax=uncultured Thiodictyon sp. TaxID=1846217 RepID=UPI0025E78E85|nr:MotA/TolQ/ExbB proton channel family protein [uncultured Thiodictyon sp.]
MTNTVEIMGVDFLSGRPPLVLRWSEPALRWLAMFLGLAIGIGAPVVAHYLVDPDTTMGRMLAFNDVQNLIPLAISSMFCWGIMICVVRWMRIRGLERVSTREILSSIEKEMEADGDLKRLDQRLEGRTCDASPLLRRLKAVIRQWSTHADLQDADVILQQHVSYDLESTQANYSLVRVFIWSLPVLGLIGTVLGIAAAVGGFSEFLGGNVEEVPEIKRNLVSVTAGLSFAFLITLQGLVTSLATMLFTSALQSREEKLYTDIQQRITDSFLPKLQRVVPVAHSDPGVSIAEDMNGVWKERFSEVTREIGEAIMGVGRQWLEVLGEEQRLAAAKLNEQAQFSLTALQEAAQGVMGDVGSIGNQLLERSKELLEAERRDMKDWQTSTLGEVGSGIADQRAALSAATSQFSVAQEKLAVSLVDLSTVVAQSCAVQEQQSQLVSQQHLEWRAAIAEQQGAVQTTVASLVSLTEQTNTVFTENVAAVRAALEDLQKADLTRVLAGLANALTSQTQDLRATAEAVRGLGVLTEKITVVQTDLQDAVRQLHEAGFSDALTGVGRSLEGLGTVLEQFRKPFVLQAVTLDSEPARQGGAAP